MSDRESVRDEIANTLSAMGWDIGHVEVQRLSERIEAALRAAGRRALITPTLDMETFDTECVRAGIAALRGETHE